MLDRKYDLIITDLMMAGGNDFAVLKSVMELNSKQAVFIITGYGELDSAINTLRLGAANYFLQPYASKRNYCSGLAVAYDYIL